MDIFVSIILLEIISINTYTTYACSKNKNAAFESILSLSAVTAVFSVLLYLVFSKVLGASESFDGKGIFIPFGIFYILPLKLIFDLSLKHLAVIMSSSWVYTTFIFSLSVRYSYMLSSDQLSLSVFIIQTLLFLVTLPFYIKFVKKTFQYIHKHIEGKMINALLMISVSWFIIIFLINYIFVEGSTFVSEFLILFLVIGNAVLSYNMFSNLVSVNDKARTLDYLVKIDPLTNLKNRQSFYDDMAQKIEENMPFAIVFIDLDDFKSVNDAFGHAFGDTYLIEFVKTVQTLLKISDTFYRLHGDEFVIISSGIELETQCNKIKNMQFQKALGGVAFKGLSFGQASYPQDAKTLSDLLHLADSKMYQAKKEQYKQ